MNLVADESVDRPIVVALRREGHEVIYIAELDPGINDQTVLAISSEKKAPLLTADKDFGELVFRQRLLHHGVILLRLAGQSLDIKSALIVDFVKNHASELAGGFAVITAQSARIRRV